MTTRRTHMRSLPLTPVKRLICLAVGHNLTQVAGIIYRRGWCRRCNRTIVLGP